MIRLLNYIKFNLAILKNLFILADKKIKFVFYSENKFYQKYSVSMIDLIAKKYSSKFIMLVQIYMTKLIIKTLRTYL